MDSKQSGRGPSFCLSPLQKQNGGEGVRREGSSCFVLRERQRVREREWCQPLLCFESVRNRVGPRVAYRKAARKGARLLTAHTHTQTNFFLIKKKIVYVIYIYILYTLTRTTHFSCLTALDFLPWVSSFEQQRAEWVIELLTAVQTSVKQVSIA